MTGALVAVMVATAVQAAFAAPYEFPSHGECWCVSEWTFSSARDYSAGGGDALVFDMSFTCPQTGETLVRPAFWDGDRTFRVRFAPTSVGRWTWRTSCAADATLDDRTGAFEAVAYSGPHEIYRRGFVRAEPGRKHFAYADGTPFFYLGDTHWGMYTEEIDEPGPHAGKSGATSHFKHVVDRRAAQGFTVYQSEPISAPFDVRDGRVDAADIAGFRTADRYYRHIADAGLVHANAEFFFAAEMRRELAADEAAIDRLCRYWTARFGAYPVMWTLAQEIDNDFYAEKGRAHNFYSVTNNPWVKVAAALRRHDAYRHPLSGHQENTLNTTVTGASAQHLPDKRPDLGRSVFADPEMARAVGHDWWAVQWSPSLVSIPDHRITREYWQSERTAVNYEGRYCYLWTKDFGARAQGWISYLNGFRGYGYGAIDLWLYRSRYDIDKSSHDGYEKITPDDKQVKWCDAVEFPSAVQMGYMRRFFTRLPWWTLEPDLGRGKYFAPAKADCAVSAASDGMGLYVLYFNGTNTLTGTLRGCAGGASCKGTWFDPRAGVEASAFARTAAADGTLALPPKPDAADWVLTVRAEFCRSGRISCRLNTRNTKEVPYK